MSFSLVGLDIFKHVWHNVLGICGLEANIVENLERSGETNTTNSTFHDLYKENPKILLAELEVSKRET